MADTLSEIYNDTLVESDFTNGEATILTTNSSTAHVIKNVQAIETDTTIPVGGTLEVNGFDIVALSGNSSGSEIIAPSSTVKVKATGFPLRYSDDEFNVRTGSTNYITTTSASVNDMVAIEEIYDATNAITANITQNEQADVFAPFIGSNDYHYIYGTNWNSTTNAYIYNQSNQVILNASRSYEPKWFDGEQYAYYYTSELSPYGLKRIDIANASQTTLFQQDLGYTSSDPKIFGYEDEYLWFWANAGEIGYVYNIANNSVTAFTNDSVQNCYSTWWQNRGMYAVKRSNGSFRFVVPYGTASIRYMDWSVGDVHTSSTTYTSISLNSNSEQFRNNLANMGVVGSRLYYINNDSEKVAFWDFDPDTPTHGTIGTNQLTYGYGPDLTHVKRTPSSATISGRSGYPNPSLKLRMTGVTST